MKSPATETSFRTSVVRLLAPAAVLAVGVLFTASNSHARPDYTRRTRQECRYCHPPGGWYINDAGKYFRDHRTLDGYKPPAENKPAAPSTKQDDKSNQKQANHS